MEETKHIVILAAGDFPTHPVPLRALREADFVVCCDSAYCRFSVFNAQYSIPFVAIGDGDSLPLCTKRELGDRWIQVDEQDYNDLHKAMSWAASQFTIHNSQFTILGATGRREDHTVGNIAYLATFAEEYPGADIEILTDYGRLCAVSGGCRLATFPGQQVSLFSLTPDSPVSAGGLRWPLREMRVRLWWQATLNEALGDSVSLRTEGRLIVFLAYDAKVIPASV